LSSFDDVTIVRARIINEIH